MVRVGVGCCGSPNGMTSVWARVTFPGPLVLSDCSYLPALGPPPQVSIAVGLAAFACVLLVVLFIMINKYGRRSKFGMKGKVGFSLAMVSWWGGGAGGIVFLLIKRGCFILPLLPKKASAGGLKASWWRILSAPHCWVPSLVVMA